MNYEKEFQKALMGDEGEKATKLTFELFPKK